MLSPLNKLNKFFITGIGTDIGKTIASAILVEKFEADYWKPIQAGSLEFSDTARVQSLVTNSKSVFFKEFYRLKHSCSPHKAAALENLTIKTKDIKAPETPSILFCEGAGGLMVPMNGQELMIDLIKHLSYSIILVSKHYLGSINHTLLSIAKIKEENLPLKGILFIGEEDHYTEDIILNQTSVNFLGRIPILKEINPKTIKKAGEYINLTLS